MVSSSMFRSGRRFAALAHHRCLARFGVTAEYLVNADQLQIKMAQGAKPGVKAASCLDTKSRIHREAAFSVPGVGLSLAAAAPTTFTRSRIWRS
jgi:hypothetical protein